MYFVCSQDPLTGASKRANAGDSAGAGRAKASKKDLSQSDIEQAIRNGRVIRLKFIHDVILVFKFIYELFDCLLPKNTVGSGDCSTS